jgi:hypothetical protein
MPAKDTVLHHLSDTEATTKMIRKDVDNLVQNIKDNLKLSFEAVQQHDKSAAVASRPFSYADFHTTVDSTNNLQPRYPPLSGGSRKARSYMSSKGSSRASPYSLPGGAKCDCDESGRPGSWAARKRYPSMSAAGKPKIELDDPLEMLQELIRLAHQARFCAGRSDFASDPPYSLVYLVVASLRVQYVCDGAKVSAPHPTANMFLLRHQSPVF